MKPNDQVKMDLSISSGSLIGQLEGFPENLFHNKPSPENWSAAEITEHLVVLEGLIIGWINGPTILASNDRGSQVHLIAATFGDQQKKLNAHEFIQPKGMKMQPRELIQSMREQRNTLFHLAADLDLSPVCTGFTHRSFGMLTRLEWMYFCIFHGDRHLHQLLRLERHLGAVVANE